MDYSTAILNVVWAIMVFAFVSFFPSMNIKIGVFIILYFPLLLFSLLGFNNENIIYVISYLFKYFINYKIYFYSKD